MPDEQEFNFEVPCDAENINAAFNALLAIENIDTELLDRKEQSKIRIIRSKSVSIIYHSINNVYDSIFGSEDND